MVTIVETTTGPSRREMTSWILEHSMMCATQQLQSDKGAVPSGLDSIQGRKAGVEGVVRCPSLPGCDDRMGEYTVTWLSTLVTSRGCAWMDWG